MDGLEVEEGNESAEEEDPQPELLKEGGVEYEVEEEEPKESGPESDAGRLYVGNLPYSMTSTQLSEIFGEAGTVTYTEV